jgi:heme oxygenase
LPSLDSEAALYGCAYVVEGSTLGGRLLATAVAPLLGHGTRGRRFHLGYGERHGAMWRAFTDALEAVPQDGFDEMAAAATATFEAYEDWIGGPQSAIAARAVSQSRPS